MTSKTKNIIGWSVSGLVGIMLTASAIDKIMVSENALKMSTSFGISASIYSILGIIEIISVMLFLIPRTSILGLLLLSSYYRWCYCYSRTTWAKAKHSVFCYL